MHILSLFCLCYFIQFSHCLLFSNLLSYLGLRPSCLCRCGIVNSGRYSLLDKIRGVDPIPPNTMPWLVFIHANDSIIPGTLISNRHVITAASRVYALSPSMAFVQIGSNNFCNNNGLNYSVEAIRIPSGYTPSSGVSDLALLRLANEVSFNQYISPICLPLSWRDYTRRTAIVSTLPNNDVGSRCIARATIFSLVDGSTCSYQANYTVDKGCVGPTGPSYVTLFDEDVGAAVMTRRRGLPHVRPFRLIGVLSSASNSSQPSIYTKINDHRSFIYQNTQGDCMCV